MRPKIIASSEVSLKALPSVRSRQHRVNLRATQFQCWCADSKARGRTNRREANTPERGTRIIKNADQSRLTRIYNRSAAGTFDHPGESLTGRFHPRPF